MHLRMWDFFCTFAADFLILAFYGFKRQHK